VEVGEHHDEVLIDSFAGLFLSLFTSLATDSSVHRYNRTAPFLFTHAPNTMLLSKNQTGQ
jgi:hypothetical protein